MRKRGHLILIFALFLLYPHIASAGTADSSITEIVEGTTIEIVRTLIKYLNMALWPLLMIIGDLMSNDLIIGPGMEERLLSIWQQIRNLVNIGFVLILLVMAFYNVSGFAKEGNFALKTGLPKLIIGLILVNFTFLGGKLILDLSNLATNAVFALPELTMDTEAKPFDFEKNVNEFESNLCVKADGTTYDTTKDDEVPPLVTIFCDNDGKGKYESTLGTLQKSQFFKSLNVNNVGLIIAVNMGHLETLNYTDKSVKKIGDFVVNQLFSITMFVVFAVSYIVLVLVLIARIAVLWVAMALSPIIVLFYVVPDLKNSAGEGGKVVETVFTHILAPIKIGIVLTIGFMMMDAMYGVVGAASTSAIGKSKLSELASGSLLITGIADLHKLLIALTSIVFLWKAVFWAADNTFAKGMIDKVKGGVEGAATTALSYLKYTPLVPVQVPNDKGEKKDVAFSLFQLGKVLPDIVSSKESTQTKEIEGALSRLGFINNDIGAAFDRLAYSLKNNPENTSKYEIKTGLLDGKGLNNISDSSVKSGYDTIIRGLIDKYANENEKAIELDKYKKIQDNPQQLRDFIVTITKKGSIDWTENEKRALLGTPATPPATPPVTPPVAPATSPTPTTVDMKVTLESKIPKGVTLTIPTTLRIPDTVKDFKGLTSANSATFQGKLTQGRLDTYMKAHAGATQIDVDEFNKLS